MSKAVKIFQKVHDQLESTKEYLESVRELWLENNATSEEYSFADEIIEGIQEQIDLIFDEYLNDNG